MKSAIVKSGPMPTRELPHYWMPEQVRQILATMPAGQPWLFALLLWRSALRQAEALDLEWRGPFLCGRVTRHYGAGRQGRPLPTGAGAPRTGGRLPGRETR